MIQQGVFTLVLSVCLLGVSGFFSPFLKHENAIPEIEIDTMTLCLEEAPSNRNLTIKKVSPIKNALKPAISEQNDAITILLEVVPEMMKFDQDTITVKAGRKIILELDNLDGMQHNLLILKPNTLEKVGQAADAMLRDPMASEKHYVPDMPEVLFATEMLGPNELYTLKFTAPTTPGNYPFVCTFPGHWRMMSGIMVVVKS